MSTSASTSERRATRDVTVLVCVCACTVLVVGFVASVNLAAPMLAASTLHPSSAQLLWIIDAYVVFFACLVIPGGVLGDRYGRKGVLIAGLVVFGLGAAGTAVAPDVAVALIGRAITGAGAAAVLPNALAVLVHATRPQHRSAAIAVWAAMSGVGGVAGNVGGGALLTTGSWRWLFAAVAPIALACAAWVAVATPRSDRSARALDPRAAVLLTLATLALLLGIIQGPEQGWRNPLVLGAFGAAIGLTATWVVGELRVPEPMLDPRLFRIPALRAACLGMLVVFFGMFALFYLNASVLQYGRDFSVLQTGLGIVPLTIPLLVAARRVPALVARFGDAVVLGAAFVITGGGLWGLATAIGEPYAVYAVWLVVVGVGVTLALPSLTVSIAAALPRERAGVAGGLQATTRELGSALGVAVIGTVVTSQFGRRIAGGGTRTVAQELAARPTSHAVVIRAYAASADTALKVVAVIVLVAGALVVAETTWSARRRFVG